MKNRGQEGAPFEVLVSVVIMTFVIIIALQAMKVVTDEQCKASIQRAGSDLKTKIQEVSKGNDTTLNFDPPKCFSNKKETIQLKTLDDQALCNFYCGGTRQHCLMFLFDAEDFRQYTCLESASVLTQFITQDASTCEERDGYKLQDFHSQIPRGSYVLVNKSGSDNVFPKICAYLRVQGA